MKLFIIKIKKENYPDILNFLKLKLTTEECTAVNDYKFEKGKITKSISILLSRYVIEEHFKLKNYTITKNKYGKPYIADKNNCFYNISHSEDYIICGASEHELGVDIEKMKPFRDILEIAKRFFSQKEYEYINKKLSSKEQIETFYEIWTKKESFIKAVGQGVSLGLDKFTVPFICDNNKKIIYNDIVWYFTNIIDIDVEFPVSICEKNCCSDKILIEKLSLNQL